jgi:hypothetical protein
MRCHSLAPGAAAPAVEPTPVDTHRVIFRYAAEGALQTVHVIEVGDGMRPAAAVEAKVRETDTAVEVTLAGRTFAFAKQSPFAVTMEETVAGNE